MAIPEYRFRKECPKCDSSALRRKFTSAESIKTEYLDCICDVCGFKYTMQTNEGEFKQMSVSLKLEESI